MSALDLAILGTAVLCLLAAGSTLAFLVSIIRTRRTWE